MFCMPACAQVSFVKRRPSNRWRSNSQQCRNWSSRVDGGGHRKADPLTAALEWNPAPHFFPIRVQIRLMHRRGGKPPPLSFIPSLLFSGSAKISLLLEGSDCHKVSEVRGETLRVIIRSHHDLIPVCTSPLGVVSCQRDIWTPSTLTPTPQTPTPHNLWTVVVWCFEEKKIKAWK